MLQSIPYGTLQSVLHPEMIAIIDGEVERRVEEMRTKLLTALAEELRPAPVVEEALQRPAPPRSAPKGRKRRSSGRHRAAKVPTVEVAAEVLAVVKRARAKGLRAEHIQIAGYTKNQIQRALRHLCSTGAVTWTGEKRATTYRAA